MKRTAGETSSDHDDDAPWDEDEGNNSTNKSNPSASTSSTAKKATLFANKNKMAFKNRIITRRNKKKYDESPRGTQHRKRQEREQDQNGRTEKSTIRSLSSETNDYEKQVTVEEEEDDDTVLKHMDIVLRKRLRNLSVDQLYDTCWSDSRNSSSSGDGGDSNTPDAEDSSSQSSFYSTWLQQDDKHSIESEKWQMRGKQQKQDEGGDDDSNFLNDWDNETYDQKRIYKYSYDRDPNTLGYSLGKPVVHVTQTQYYRTEIITTSGQRKRSVIAMVTEMDGEVYSNSFVIHIRGVITEVSERFTDVDFGVFCYFTRNVLIANKVRGIVIESTRDQVVDLFGKMKDACAGAVDIERFANKDERLLATTSMTPGRAEEEEAEDGEGALLLVDNSSSRGKKPFTCQLFSICMPRNEESPVDGIVGENDDIDMALNGIRSKIKVVVLSATTSNTTATKGEEKERRKIINYVKSEMDIIHEALDCILIRSMESSASDDTSGSSSAAEAGTGGPNNTNKRGVVTAVTAKVNSTRERAQKVVKKYGGAGSKFVSRPTEWFKTTSRGEGRWTTRRNNRRDSIIRGAGGVGEGVSRRQQQQQQRRRASLIVGPRDSILDGMNCIISEKIMGASVQDFYDMFFEKFNVYTCLSGNARHKTTNIKIGHWEHGNNNNNNNAGGFLDAWSKERYPYKRTITYDREVPASPTTTTATTTAGKWRRRESDDSSTSIMIKSTNTQYLRMDVNDVYERCIVTTNVVTSGAWFSEYSELQTRWVFTTASSSTEADADAESSSTVEDTMMQIKVGMFVSIKKKTRHSLKIKAHMTQYAMESSSFLLDAIKKQLGLAPSTTDSSGNTSLQQVLDQQLQLEHRNPVVTPFLAHYIPCWLRDQHHGEENYYFTIPTGSIFVSDKDLERQFHRMTRKLRAVVAILNKEDQHDDYEEEGGDEEELNDMHFYLSQLEIIRESLDNIAYPYY